MPIARTISVAGLGLILAVGASVANADMTVTSGTWFMDQSNTFADGVHNYGRVTIHANSTSGLVQFTVEAFNVQPEYGALNNFGIDQFSFSFDHVDSSPGDWVWTVPTDWDHSPPPLVPRQDGFGDFMVQVTGPGNREDLLTFAFLLPTASQAVASNFAVLSDGTAGEGQVLFAAHVAGFANGEESHHIGGSTVVPAPGATVLGMIGLGTIGWLKRYLT